MARRRGRGPTFEPNKGKSMSGELRIVIEDDDTDVVSKPRGAADDSIEEIQRRADQAAAEAARLRHETAHHRATIARTKVGTALMKADSEAQVAAAEYRNALEAGDIDAQAGAQARLAEVEARRVRLLEHEQALRNSPVIPADPVEAACAGLSERSAQWLRAHPDYVLDQRKNAKIRAAHFDAVAEGLQEDSPEYFAHVERHVGLGDGAKNARSGGDHSGARPAAKIDRNNPNTHVMRGGAEVFLTKGERERATDGTLTWNHGPKRGQPIGIAEFARRKAAMHAEGRYSQLNDLAK
jgi:hypothetical protein